MRDAVLIIGGGLLQIPAIRIGRDMGLAVIVTDGNPKAPGMAVADEAVPLDIYDLAGHQRLVAELASRYRLRGVFAEGADVELTVAVAARQAGLPGIAVETARRCKNKALMRQAFDRAGLGQVPWGEARTAQEARSWAETIGYPVAVKAVDNCGSRGFTRATSLEEVDAAFLRAASASTTGTALVEACLTGAEQSVELLFDAGGTCHRLNVVDRIFGEGPWAVELGHVNPSQLGGSVQEAIFELAERAAAAVGVRFGAFKADTILTADGPRILEVTARLSGGFDCQYTTPLATGRNFIRAALSLAVGRTVDPEDLRRTRQRCAAAWTVFPKPGVVRAITGIDTALALPGVKHVFMRINEGEVIPPYQDCVARPAFVIVEGRDADEVFERAKAAAATVQITTTADSALVA